MFEITRLTVEHLAAGCVTDCSTPRIGFSLSSDRRGAQLADAELTVGDWSAHVTSGQSAAYVGPALLPFTTYSVRLNATDDAGETATATTAFETGRMETPWKGRWISDPSYHFTEAKVSPVPMVFRKEITTNKPIARARLYATAMGIYEAELNGQKLGEQYFAPGFTSYKSYLQYQTYDVTALLTGDDTLTFTVAGGWAVGSFVFTRKNRVTADRQALLAELRIEYMDGTTETIGTDATWQVSESGPVRMADLYDGETYDATQEISDWHNAAPETLKVTPAITADYGAPVKAHEVRKPVAVMTAPDGETIYDFGQNLAGVVRIKFNGKAGQVVTVRHAEILNPDGSLNTTFLRTAKATATYTCRDGEQTYSPRFSYMGFRYAGVKGVDAKDLEIEAVALYSDVEHSGSFRCSDEMLNKLQSNITWGAKSNFVDIPTDCPQRDERMGWTGDIAVFSPTALYNFELSRFLEKWLRDVKAEQLGVMTAFNRVGITAANAHTGLLKNILRGEWGFKGLESQDFIMNPNYAVLKEYALNGGTMTTFTGENTMAAVSEKFAYWTTENVGQDTELMSAIKQAMTWQAYALANSNALDGMASSTRLVSVRTWYDNALVAVQVVFAALTVLAAAMYVLNDRKSKKQ